MHILYVYTKCIQKYVKNNKETPTLLQIVHGGHAPTSQHSGEDGELLQLRRGHPHLPLKTLPGSLLDKLSAEHVHNVKN